MSEKELVKIQNEIIPQMMNEVGSHLIEVRGEKVLLDSFVAKLYGVETREVNQALKNNPDKFPPTYSYKLSTNELTDLRSKRLITNISPKSRSLPTVFTEKGLYMLATILKSKKATAATFAIIETFAAVRELKRELVNLHRETDLKVQQSKMKRFGEVLSDIVMPDLETAETESTLELNFIIGKIKHTVKRVKTSKKEDES